MLENFLNGLIQFKKKLERVFNIYLLIQNTASFKNVLNMYINVDIIPLAETDIVAGKGEKFFFGAVGVLITET